MKTTPRIVEEQTEDLWEAKKMVKNSKKKSAEDCKLWKLCRPILGQWEEEVMDKSFRKHHIPRYLLRWILGVSDMALWLEAAPFKTKPRKFQLYPV